MNLFKRIRAIREANAQALAANMQVLIAARQHGEIADESHGVALARFREASEQAERLRATDRRNHFSQSLTEALRGKTT